MMRQSKNAHNVHTSEYILIFIAILSVLAIIIVSNITGNAVGLFVRVAPGIQLYNPNITFEQNATIIGNFSSTFSYLYSSYNTTAEFNLSFPNGTITSINLTIIANTTRDIF